MESAVSPVRRVGRGEILLIGYYSFSGGLRSPDISVFIAVVLSDFFQKQKRPLRVLYSLFDGAQSQGALAVKHVIHWRLYLTEQKP